MGSGHGFFRRKKRKIRVLRRRRHESEKWKRIKKGLA